jgi:uncharacterized protein (DUF1684 family)
MTEKTYRQIVNEWRAERDESIRKENGWIALAGLFWLKLGKNRIGSDPLNEIQLPKRAPAQLGQLDYNGRSVSLRVTDGTKVNVNDKLVDFSILQPDIADNPSYMTLNDLRLVVIQRGNRIGVRMWDNLREERRTFPTRAWFDIDENFRVPAHYTAYEKPKMAFFPDLSGEKSELPVDGYFSFEFNGASCKLDVSKEDSDYFIRFWDPTSGAETYPTGRYMLAEVDNAGKVILDFNKAYNPPCAFTNFATCVFAPEQNRLNFKVLAGERYEKH